MFNEIRISRFQGILDFYGFSPTKSKTWLRSCDWVLFLTKIYQNFIISTIALYNENKSALLSSSLSSSLSLSLSLSLFLSLSLCSPLGRVVRNSITYNTI